jgi:hypothetical protein
LLAATDSWLHALDAAPPALAVTDSMLVVWPAATPVFAAISRTAAGFAGVDFGGAIVTGVVDLAAPHVAAADARALITRNWEAALALRLNDNGDAVPFDP